jgi:predicted transcriptional regulator
MEDNSTGESLLQNLIASDVKAQLLVLFRRNPGLIDEAEGIARRVGKRKESVEADLKDLVEIGVVQEKRIGPTAVFSLNAKKDAEVQREVGTYLMGIKDR